MRRLGQTLLVGGVVYPAGTREEDIAGPVSRDDVWENGGSATVSVSISDSAEVGEALIAAEGTITVLRERVAELEAELETERARVPQPSGDGSNPAYADLDVDALKAEIDKRNEDREQDDRISKRGSAETLVAALVADDQRKG